MCVLFTVSGVISSKLLANWGTAEKKRNEQPKKQPNTLHLHYSLCFIHNRTFVLKDFFLTKLLNSSEGAKVK